MGETAIASCLNHFQYSRSPFLPVVLEMTSPSSIEGGCTDVLS